MLNRHQIRSLEERLEHLRQTGRTESDEYVETFQVLAAEANDRERMGDRRFPDLHRGLRQQVGAN
jgi:hypothetical protein